MALSAADMERVRGKHIGMVLQNAMAALDPVFTIGLQVGEPLVVHEKIPWKAALRRVVELLRMVKVVAPEIRVYNYPHELSGGMRQRVSSAAAIGCQPSLLIADEPTTALDVTTQRQYLDLLMELQQATGMAIIFVTHDISLVGNMCDHIAVFYGGTDRRIRATPAGAQSSQPSVYGGAVAIDSPARRAARPAAEHCRRPTRSEPSAIWLLFPPALPDGARRSARRASRHRCFP